MTDLIWVGNVLLPRWFVFSVPVVVLLSVFLMAWFAAFLFGARHD